MITILSLIVAAHVLAIAGGFVAVAFPNIFKRYLIYHRDLLRQVPHRSVTFDSRDGTARLHALFFANTNTTRAVLLCHGRSSNKTRELPYARDFLSRWNVLALDFRSHGENRSGTTSIGMKESQDVLGALDWLAKQGMTDIAIVGHSMGGAAAIKALSEMDGAESARVKALVIEGVYSSLDNLLRRQARQFFAPSTMSWPAFRLAEYVAGYRIADNAPERMIGDVPCPVLILQADRERLCPPDSAERLYAAARGEKEMLYFRGRHDTPCDEVSRLAMDFIEKHL